MARGRYQHTQEGWFHWLVGSVGLFVAVLALLVSAPVPARGLLVGVGALLIVLAASFVRLTVRERGDRLEIAFGPLPIFRRSLAYGEIRNFRRARSWLIDGWGIHWVPGRGWTWNLRGRDCVEVETTHGRLRIGTDDPEGLVAHLEARTAR